MHFQIAPSREAELVRYTMGTIGDVIIDLRPASPTYLQHWAVELPSQNRLALYIPSGFAHGFQTLAAKAGLASYFTFYNQTRPHQSLDGKTPDEVYFGNQTLLLAA